MAESGCYDVINDMNQYVIALVSDVHTCKYVILNYFAHTVVDFIIK